jgi:Holliday junction resolvase RusA-like endonuclease
MARTSDPRRIGDLKAAWGRLSAPDAIHLVLPVEGKPTPRPRVTRTGIAFVPKEYAQYARDLQARLAELHSGPPLHGPLVVRVDVAKARPKKTILPAPRGDVDNFVKGVLDACTKTGRFWEDDTQIVALFVTKRWGEADEITVTINTETEDACAST